MRALLLAVDCLTDPLQVLSLPGLQRVRADAAVSAATAATSPRAIAAAAAVAATAAARASPTLHAASWRRHQVRHAARAQRGTRGW